MTGLKSAGANDDKQVIRENNETTRKISVMHAFAPN
jgi:hypothetical protein